MANRDTLEDLRIEKVRTAQAPPESSLFASHSCHMQILILFFL